MTPRDHKPTVVVPTRNSERTIVACLRSLREQTLPCTVVVVDNSSTDSTASLARPLADLVLAGGPERSAQRNQGARAVPASVLGFVDSDMVVGPRVVAEAAAAIAGGAGAVIVPEHSFGVGFWAHVRAFERTFLDGSDPIEAARFFSWEVFEATGGWDESLTGPEDWDLTIRAKRLGEIARTVDPILHDEGRLRLRDECRKKARYGPGLRAFAAKHGVGTLARTALPPFLRRPWRLVRPLGAGLIAMKAAEGTAVVWTLVRRQSLSPGRS